MKLTIVLQACQGTTDDNTLTLFDHVFNEHDKYSKYTIDDWLCIDPKSLTSIYWSCSCAYKNCVNTLTVLKALKEHFETNKNVPCELTRWWFVETTTELYNRFRGFGKKNSSLNNTRYTGISYKLRYCYR